MNDGWKRPDVDEEFGDSFVACGALGLIAGTALHEPFLGVVVGIICGAMLDGLSARRKARAARIRID